MEQSWIEKLKELSEKRLIVCQECPFRKSVMEGKTDVKAEDDACGKCGCPLKSKTTANVDEGWGKGGCPEGKW